METPTINDIDLLKVGRHFRLDGHTKLVVGRNKNENGVISAVALPGDILLEARDHMGPVSILRGKNAGSYTEFGAKVTLRYSDAPKDAESFVTVKKDSEQTQICTTSAKEESYIKFRV